MKQIVIATIIAAFAALAHAQYEIPWHSMDGGGGTSTGGAYTVRGTIGQPDAGISTGGVYQVIGGFWGWAVIVQTDGLPVLHIRYISASEAEVYWEDAGTPAVVQRRVSMTAGDWEDDPGTPVIDAQDIYRLTITPDTGMRFYRLRRNP